MALDIVEEVMPAAGNDSAEKAEEEEDKEEEVEEEEDEEEMERSAMEISKRPEDLFMIKLKYLYQMVNITFVVGKD